MIYLLMDKLSTVEDSHKLLQTAIGVEFGTLPPYLYALYSIRPGTNSGSSQRIKDIALQEMVHMCLASNILNALGGDPVLTPPTYPGPLPGDIGPHGNPLTIHLYPFSCDAIRQAMAIEQPVDPLPIPVRPLFADLAGRAVTIGQFYEALDQFLAVLPPSAWTANRQQIVDDQFFAGQIFAVNGYADAHRAIQEIVSEGEGAKNSPLTFQDEVAHYYRFGEIYHNKVLTKADNPKGYTFGPAPLDVNFQDVYPAISDPGQHDFSHEPPAAQAAQHSCDAAYTAVIDALQKALTGTARALGNAVRAMFELRQAARFAFTVPLADGTHVAGPAFRNQPTVSGGRS